VRRNGRTQALVWTLRNGLRELVRRNDRTQTLVCTLRTSLWSKVGRYGLAEALGDTLPGFVLCRWQKENWRLSRT
jgi:hypothetical protein